MKTLLRLAAGALLFSLAATASQAAEDLVVNSDQTQLLDIKGLAGAVVVGNPSIADASVHGNKVFVHGRAYGSTNIIILDPDGNALADYNVTVKLGGDNNVALYRGAMRYSYVCAPLCESTMEPADYNTDMVKELIKTNGEKTKFATGQTSVAAAPPPTPQ
jgi:hypothetical protein